MWGHLGIALARNPIVKYFRASPWPLLVLNWLRLVWIYQHRQDVYGGRLLTQESDVYLIGCKLFNTNLVAPTAIDLESLSCIFKPSDIARLICWLSICVASEDLQASLLVKFLLADKLYEKWWQLTIEVDFANHWNFVD